MKLKQIDMRLLQNKYFLIFLFIGLTLTFLGAKNKKIGYSDQGKVHFSPSAWREDSSGTTGYRYHFINDSANKEFFDTLKGKNERYIMKIFGNPLDRSYTNGKIRTISYAIYYPMEFKEKHYKVISFLFDLKGKVKSVLVAG